MPNIIKTPIETLPMKSTPQSAKLMIMLQTSANTIADTMSLSTITDFYTPRRFIINSIVSSSGSRTFESAIEKTKGKISNARTIIILRLSLASVV